MLTLSSIVVALSTGIGQFAPSPRRRNEISTSVGHRFTEVLDVLKASVLQSRTGKTDEVLVDGDDEV